MLCPRNDLPQVQRDGKSDLVRSLSLVDGLLECGGLGVEWIAEQHQSRHIVTFDGYGQGVFEESGFASNLTGAFAIWRISGRVSFQNYVNSRFSQKGSRSLSKFIGKRVQIVESRRTNVKVGVLLAFELQI